MAELALGTGRGPARRDRWGPRFALLVLACFSVAWIEVVRGGESLEVRAMTQATYCVLIIAAFLAPAMGSTARQRLERHPFFAESLASPLAGRDYAAALHGRVVVRTLLAGLFALVAWGAYNGISLMGSRPLLSDLRYSLLWPVLNGFSYEAVVRLAPDWGRMIYAAATLACVACFAAGVYLRAALLASRTQLARWSRVEGGWLTAMLLLSASLSLLVRVGLAMVLPFGAEASPLPWFAGLSLWIAATEGGLAAARLAAARRVWGMVAAEGVEPSRRELFDAP